MKTKVLVPFLSLMFIALPQFAEAEIAGRLGAEAPVVVPMSDWADVSGIGFGGLVRFEMNFTPNIAANARLGYVHHLTQTLGSREVSTWEIPFLLGFKYVADFGLFGEIALGIVKNGGRVEGMVIGASDTELGLMLGLGYQSGGFTAGAYLYSADADDIDSVIGIMANVGYTFQLF